MKKSGFGYIIFFALAFSLLFSFINSPAAALEVKRSVLDNGLKLFVVERHNLPIVMVSLGINAGSLHEDEEKAGLASMAASLLTEGTKNRTAREISEEIEFVGGSIGAAGGEDYVTASLSVLKKDIDLGFDLLSDIMLHPLFPQDEIDKKRERIKGSLRAQEEDPGFVARRHFKQEVFGSHPYGRLLTGTAETLDRITRDDLLAFHARYYNPGTAVMAVVGDITVEEVETLMSRYFAGWLPRRDTSLPSPPMITGKERNIITIDKELEQATVMLGHAGVSRNNPDYYAISVMNYILGGGGFASRLMQNIREEKGLVYDVSSFFAAEKYGGHFAISLQTKNESANRAIDEMLKEIRRIQAEPVSEQELSDAKSFLTGSFPMRIENSSRIARFLVAVDYYGLGADYIENYPRYIESVTRDDVLRVAQQYLDDQNFTLVVVADQEKAGLKKHYSD